MKTTARLFQVVNSDSEDLALFESTNSSIDDNRTIELIKRYYDSESEFFEDDNELLYFGIVRNFVQIIDVE